MSTLICRDSDGNFLKTLYQWDSNQTITVSGVDMPPIPVFHFCNRLSEKALVVTPTVSGSDLVADIPNILLQQAEPVIAYLYEDTDNDGYRTVHTIHIPVIPRPKPDDYEYEENVDYISVAILNSRVTELLHNATNASEAAVALEVIDLRTSNDGTAYETAGDFLRAVENKMNILSAHVGGVIPFTASGYISINTTKWSAVRTGAKCLIAQVSEGDNIYIKAKSSNTAQFAFLDTFSEPVQGQEADVNGSVTSVSAGRSTTVVAPSGATYLYILVTRVSGTSLIDHKPDVCTINDISILSSISDAVAELKATVSDGDLHKIEKNEGVLSLAVFADGDEYDATTNPTGWENGAYWTSNGRIENNNWKTTGIIENKQRVDLYIHYTTPRPNYMFRVAGYDMSDPSTPVYINGSFTAIYGDAEHSVVRLPYSEKLRFFRVGYYWKSSTFREDAFVINYHEDDTEVGYNIDKKILVDQVYGFDSAAKLPIEANTKRITDIETELAMNVPYLTTAAQDAFDRIMSWAGTDKVALIGQITDVHNQFDKISQMRKLNELFEFDAMIHNGDMAVGPLESAPTITEKNQIIAETKRRMNCTAPWIFVNGNHDAPVYRDDFNAVALSTLFNSSLSKRFQSAVLSDDCSYGYIDLAFAKIRLIFLNTSERTSTSTNYRISTAQYSFLIDALSTIPSGYNIFITSHVVPDATITAMGDSWNNGVVSNWRYYTYVQILNDFNAKKSGSVGTLSWDFSNIPSTVRIVCVLCGHEHLNANHVLAVSNDAGSGVNYIVRQGYGYHGTDSGSSTDYTMESGYVAKYDKFEHSENCLLDIVAIKSESGVGKVFRVGVGAPDRDLEFTWGSISNTST